MWCILGAVSHWECWDGWGKRLEMRLGQVRTGFECQVKELQIYYVVGTSLSAQLNSLI